MKARNAFRLPAKGLSEKNCAIPTWRTHSCVPRRHSCRRRAPPEKRRVEKTLRTPAAAEFGLSQAACVRGRIDDRFLSSVERRAPNPGATDDRNRSSILPGLRRRFPVRRVSSFSAARGKRRTTSGVRRIVSAFLCSFQFFARFNPVFQAPRPTPSESSQTSAGTFPRTRSIGDNRPRTRLP